MLKIVRIDGPYKHNNGRKFVHLIYEDGSSKCTSYARYLYENYHGIILRKDQAVDHIDGDCTNDSIDNLQVLSFEENNRKSVQQNNLSRRYLKFICPECGTSFEKEARRVKHNQRVQNKVGPFCSRKCAGKFNQRKK